MPLAVGAVEAGARHRQVSPADKGVAGLDGPGVQRRRAGDELEHAARLVQIADRLVAPLHLLGLLQGGGPRIAFQGVHSGPLGLVVDDAGLVGVEGGDGGHRQHRAGVHVQNDAHPPGRGAVLLDRVGEGVFEVALDGRVDGQHQAAALDGRLEDGVAMLHRVAPGVHRRQHQAALAGEGVVVFQFQPGGPGVVHIGKAQHRRQERPFRVLAAGVLVDADAGDPVLGAEVPDGPGRLPVHPVAQKAVVGAPLAELFPQACLVQLEDGGQAPGGLVQLFLRHLAGGGADGPAGGVRGQQHAVGAVDQAPAGGHHRILQLLAQGALGVPGLAGQLQPGQAGGQPGKADRAEQPRHQPGPQAEAAAGQRALVRQGNNGFVGHGRPSFQATVCGKAPLA